MKKILTKILLAGLLFGIVSCSTSKDNNSQGKKGPINEVLGVWELESIGTDNSIDILKSFPEGVPYLNFLSKNSLNASDGCNTLNGQVKITEEIIEFSPLMSTAKACEGIDGYVFSSKLNDKVDYKIVDNKLVLTKNGVEILKFNRPQSINGTWKLSELVRKDNSQKSLAESFPEGLPTLTFKNNTVNGNNGCNILNGSFTTGGNNINFSPILSTQKFCNGVDQGTFDELLSEVNAFDIKDKTLTFYINGNKALVFTK